MWMTFCEYAAVHKDGTMTMVRASLCEWRLQAFPAELTVWAAAHVPAHHLPNGHYLLSLSIANDAPKEIWKLDAQLQIVNDSVPLNLALPVVAFLPSPGKYSAILHVGELTTNWSFEMVQEIMPEGRTS